MTALHGRVRVRFGQGDRERNSLAPAQAIIPNLLPEMRGQELGRGLDRDVPAGEVPGISRDQRGRPAAQGAEELDGVLEVLDVGVDGLVGDLRIQGHEAEDVISEKKVVGGRGTTPATAIVLVLVLVLVLGLGFSFFA